MASGKDGDLWRAHGRRGSNGRSLAQELISGRRVLGYPGEEAFQPILFFPCVSLKSCDFHTSSALHKTGITNQLCKAVLN